MYALVFANVEVFDGVGDLDQGLLLKILRLGHQTGGQFFGKFISGTNAGMVAASAKLMGEGRFLPAHTLIA